MTSLRVRTLVELGELHEAQLRLRRVRAEGEWDQELVFGHELGHGDWCDHETFRDACRCARQMESAGMVTGRVRTLVR